MEPRTWPAQARFWAVHHSRRALESSVAALPPAARQTVVRALEERGDSLEIDFSLPSRYRESCRVSSHVVAPAMSLSIPPGGGIETTSGYSWPDLRVHHVRDVVVDQRTALVFHSGRVLTASGHGWRSARDGAFLSGAADRAARVPAVVLPPGPITPLGGIHNYGHFLLEAVPRLLRVREVQPDVLALIPEPVPSYAREILGLLELPWMAMPATRVCRSDDVWLCDPTPSGWAHPADMQLLRDRLLAAVPTGGGGPSRLYVSRAGLARAAQDAERIEAGLAELGYTVLRPQTLSVGQQVALFAGASDVVADFGAGMSTIVVMPPGGRVVDLTTGEWWTPHFRQLAATMGLQYAVVALPASDEAPFGRADDAVRLLAPLVQRG